MKSCGEKIQNGGYSARYAENWNQTAKELEVPILIKNNDQNKNGQIDFEDVSLSIEATDEQLAGSGLALDNPKLTQMIDGHVKYVSETLEAKRIALLNQSLTQRKEVEDVVDISHLTKGEKVLLKGLIDKLFPLLDRYANICLYGSQRTEKMEKLLEGADRFSKEQAFRRKGDHCHPNIKDGRCSVFKDFSEVIAWNNKYKGYVRSVVLPADLKPEDEKWMKEKFEGPKNKNPFFSNMTVIERDEKDGFKWTPKVEHPLTRGIMSEIASLARELAQIPEGENGIAKTLKNQLTALAETFSSSDPYAYEKLLDATTLQVEGNIELTIDVGGLPMNEGFFVFGSIRREEDTTFINKSVRPILQKMEDKLGKLSSSYKSRKLGNEQSVQFVDLFHRDVLDENWTPGETLAFTYGSGPLMKKMGRKKVSAVNSLKHKFEHIYIPLAKIAMTPAQASLVNKRGVELFNVLHEMSHNVGPYRRFKQTHNGKMVVENLGGGLFSKIEEAKADIGGLNALPKLVEQGAITREEADAVYLVYIAGIMRQMRNYDEAHGGAAQMSFGYLANQGVITVKEGRFHVELDKMPQVLEKYWAELVDLQVNGDKESAEAFINSRSKHVPKLMKILQKDLKSAGVPSDLEYKHTFVGW